MPTAQQAAAFREVLAALTGQAVDDLAAVWADWPWDDAAAVTALLLQVAPDVTLTYADIAAALAADQYDEWRDQAGASGRFTASPGDLASLDQLEASVRYAVGPLWSATPDAEAARSLLAGSVTRHVMNGSSETMVANTLRDPTAVGWERHVRPGACGFCRMLAGRGGVYRSDRVKFKSHDHCRCVVAPSWDPDAEEPTAVAFVASKRRQTPADRERVRAWLKANDLT